MKIKNISISGCSDCPMRKEGDDMGATVNFCTLYKTYTGVRIDDPYYIAIDKCIFKKKGEIHVSRKESPVTKGMTKALNVLWS